MRIILASASPRRRELIAKIPFVEVEVMPSTADEKTDEKDPAAYVVALARLKARDVHAKKGGICVGADTIVVCDGVILGKPKDEEDAIRTLRFISGKTHSVFTGVCVISDEAEYADAEETRVTVAPYDEGKIRAYVKTGSPLDKAGAYGIQDELFAPLVEKIDGERDNVIGLPVKLLESMLLRLRK
jgi:septum formation protein